MLRDRPAMAQFGERADVLHQWAARKFAGEDLHQEILWDASEPTFAAQSMLPTVGSPGRIRVRAPYGDEVNKNNAKCFEALWSSAVFELFNIANAQDFQRLGQETSAGNLTKEAFVTKVIECESRAAERTRAFYIHIYLPWAKGQHTPTDPQLWYVGVRWDSRQNLLLSQIDKRGAYWRSYERKYDSIRVRSLLEKGEIEKAIELIAGMQKQATTPEENAVILLCRGFAYGTKGDMDKAVADFTEAIRLDPKSPEAHFNRGNAFLRKGDLDKAIADFTESIRLDPRHAETFGGRGSSCRLKGNYDKAIADYTEAIRLAPVYSDNYFSGLTTIRIPG